MQDNRVTVTAKEYREKFKEGSKESQDGDLRRRAKKTLTGSKQLLSPNWQTNKYDWEGIDAKRYPKIKTSNILGKLTGDMPNSDYHVLKFNIVSTKTKEKLLRYRPMYKGSPIGSISAYTSLKGAKNICKQHYGRLTGQIKNIKQEDAFLKQANKTKQTASLIRRAELDNISRDYYDEQEEDFEINKHERQEEAAFKKSMRGFDIHFRGY